MAIVYFSLGSNKGDRLNWLVNATKLIEAIIGKVICYSPVVETEPWGFKAETSFFNQVLIVETKLTPIKVLEHILDIEKTLGRIRSGNGYSSRIIDIDILFYDKKQIVSERLVIPHPLLHQRKFVLVPLAAIAPDLIHPVFQLTVSELLNQLDDTSQVSIVEEKTEMKGILNTIKQR